MNKRIIGIDIARAFAIIGMILVNFKSVLGGEGTSWIKAYSSILDGKAAATFVVLAGVGISLMAKNAITQKNLKKLQLIKKNLAKRALFLWIFGLSFYLVWPADILHFYAIYILISILFLTASNRLLWGLILSIVIGYPLILGLTDYETGWNFSNLEYLDFFTINGFIRNLFINGFHPVWPWVTFMLLGVWFGRQDLNDHSVLKKYLCWSSLVFIITQGGSFLSIEFLASDSSVSKAAATELLGTAPMPPLPFYMISGGSIAILITCLCILIGKAFEGTKWVNILAHTGQLALTFYVAHVVVGIGLIQMFYPKTLGTYSLEFSVITALIFSVCCLIFAAFWWNKHQAGPLEWVLRKLTA